MTTRNKNKIGSDLLTTDIPMCGVKFTYLDILPCDNLKTFLQKLDSALSSLTIGAGTQSLKLKVNADGVGTPSAEFDGYVAAANIIHHLSLVGKKLVMVTINGQSFNDFSGINQISLDNDGNLDLTSAGGVLNGDWLIIFFK